MCCKHCFLFKKSLIGTNDDIVISENSKIVDVNLKKENIESSFKICKAESVDTDQLETVDNLAGKTKEHKYNYDLVVIGGGSGGLAAAKEASLLGAKVACLDFVKPSPKGSTWGLGGTCVNVGCIPKKLMHTAALLREGINDAEKFGWEFKNGLHVTHNWETLRNAVHAHILSLNWGYKVALREKKVQYINGFATFIDKHTVLATLKNGNTEEITSKRFIISTGGRPRYPDIPGVKEHCITSDDLFTLKHPPEKTLVVGASFVSLECSGFLNTLGYKVVVYVRSILLRGFDQQLAEMIGAYMENKGVKIKRGWEPIKIEKDEKGMLSVTSKFMGKEQVEKFDTVLIAVGRDPLTKELGVGKVGIKLNSHNGRIIVDSADRTNVDNIYAIGDICDGRPELTPVAIQSGKFLVRRLYGNSTTLVDYVNIPVTIFTPIEYGTIGYSEELAIKKYGEDDLEIYHQHFLPLEWTVAERDNKSCYLKLICVKSLHLKVVGLHVLGPNAGEVAQGWTIGMRMGATKKDFENTIGIHPTCSEHFTTIFITKRSGKDPVVSGC